MLYSHFVGRIGKDGAKVINGKWGDFMSMDVVTDFYSKGENKTQWIRVRSKRANHIKLAQYLTQGRMILVQGTQLEDSSWTGKDNQPHSQQETRGRQHTGECPTGRDDGDSSDTST